MTQVGGDYFRFDDEITPTANSVDYNLGQSVADHVWTAQKKGGANLTYHRFQPQRGRSMSVALAEEHENLQFARRTQAIENGHLVKFVETVVDQHSGACGQAMCFEPCSRGSLLQEVQRRAESKEGLVFTASQVISIGVQVLDGVESLHEAGLVHRDICTRTVLLDTPGEGALRVKIGRVGVGDYPVPSYARLSNKRVSPRTAPEVHSGQDWQTKADMFSVGVVLFELMTLGWPANLQPRPPNDPATDMNEQPDVLQAWRNSVGGLHQHFRNELQGPTLRNLYGDGLCEIVLRMLSASPAARPTASEAFDLLRGMRRAAIVFKDPRQVSRPRFIEWMDQLLAEAPLQSGGVFLRSVGAAKSPEGEAFLEFELGVRANAPANSKPDAADPGFAALLRAAQDRNSSMWASAQSLAHVAGLSQYIPPWQLAGQDGFEALHTWVNPLTQYHPFIGFYTQPAQPQQPPQPSPPTSARPLQPQQPNQNLRPGVSSSQVELQEQKDDGGGNNQQQQQSNQNVYQQQHYQQQQQPSNNNAVQQLVTQVRQGEEAPRPPANNAPAQADSGPSWLQRLFCCACCISPPPPTDFTPFPPDVPTPPRPMLLRALQPGEPKRITLVLDLDETLVHSSFKPCTNDFTIDILLESVVHRVYVRKRPGVDHFLRSVARVFEVVIFTASLSQYANPLLDILDPEGFIEARLYRESCVQHYGNYVKDLTHLGRDIQKTVIVDNSPFAYMFQPENAIACTTWFEDPNDHELYDLLPFLDSLKPVTDVRTVLSKGGPFDGGPGR